MHIRRLARKLDIGGKGHAIATLRIKRVAMLRRLRKTPVMLSGRFSARKRREVGTRLIRMNLRVRG